MLNSHVLFIPATEQDKLRSRIYQQNRRNAVKASLIERIEVLVRENFEKLSEDASTPVDVAQIEIVVKDTVTKLTGSKKKRIMKTFKWFNFKNPVRQARRDS